MFKKNIVLAGNPTVKQMDTKEATCIVLQNANYYRKFSYNIHTEWWFILKHEIVSLNLECIDDKRIMYLQARS